MERSTLSIELEEQEEILPDYVIQRLVIRLQDSITKHNAARIIHFTYCSMLNILKKVNLRLSRLKCISKIQYIYVSQNQVILKNFPCFVSITL
jgi:hypothetical protein